MNLSQITSGFVVGAIGGLLFLHSAQVVPEAARPLPSNPSAQAAPTPAGTPEANIVDGKVNGLAVFMVEYIAKSANQSGTTEITKLIADQKTFVDALDSRGAVFMAGMFLNDGNRAVVFASKTEDDARKIVNESPFAKSGYFTVKLRQLSVTHAGILPKKPGPRPIEITATPD